MYLRLPVIPVRFTCILQGTFCDTGIPHNFYGEKICSVLLWRHVQLIKSDSEPFLFCLLQIMLSYSLIKNSIIVLKMCYKFHFAFRRATRFGTRCRNCCCFYWWYPHFLTADWAETCGGCNYVMYAAMREERFINIIFSSKYWKTIRNNFHK